MWSGRKRHLDNLFGMGIATCPWENMVTSDMGLAIAGFIILFILFVILPRKLMR